MNNVYICSRATVLECTILRREPYKTQDFVPLQSTVKLKSLTRNETLSTVCLHLYSDGSSTCYSNVTVNFDLLTPKFNEFMSVHSTSLVYHKFGENLTNTFQDIVLQAQKGLFPAYFIPQWPWPLSFWTQIVKRSSLSHNASLTLSLVKTCQILCKILR